MRDYSKVAPQFWTGTTGRALRAAGPEALVAALHLITNPAANMLGLYYIARPTIAHETGLTLDETRQALVKIAELGFAYYDDGTETCWVTEMARFQIGECLKPGDNRIKGIVKELGRILKSPFSQAFYEKYRAPFNLPALDWWHTNGLVTTPAAQKSANGSGEPVPELVNHAGDDVPQTQQTQPNAVDHHAEFLVGLARRPVYRQLDLESERQKAEAWIEANPSKRPKSWPRFFTNWLNRALRDQPPQTGSQPPSKEVVRRAMEATLRGQQDRGEA